MDTMKCHDCYNPAAPLYTSRSSGAPGPAQAGPGEPKDARVRSARTWGPRVGSAGRRDGPGNHRITGPDGPSNLGPRCGSLLTVPCISAGDRRSRRSGGLNRRGWIAAWARRSPAGTALAEQNTAATVLKAAAGHSSVRPAPRLRRDCARPVPFESGRGPGGRNRAATGKLQCESPSQVQ
jgi:hypothetical protein